LRHRHCGGTSLFCWMYRLPSSWSNVRS